ncbi:MAG TPA: phenylalanine--tRNA ligase subunit alpha [Chloroflexota bacterium]|jgi:phenylalanyl-tRNA synthetase alpha chain|nr:phenylalanine--tRNA ligase subunit alpha [Chloroflexota bacterium]
MIDQLENLRQRALAELAAARERDALEEWRVRYLGDRRGELTRLLRGLSSVPPAARPAVGKAANELKDALESAFRERKSAFEEQAAAAVGGIDVTLPGRRVPLGQIHPTTRAVREIVALFDALGFRVVEGPEVEWDRYNFELLNIPADHPARDMHDTYWIERPCAPAPAGAHGPGSVLLRTHTSPNQVRVMEQSEPPVRVVVPGKVYRYEAIDATHETMFYQIEGLAVDRGITMADLKGTLTDFAQALFGGERRVMFYCSYFPFVEPGVEVAIDCFQCQGAGCRLCKNSGWIEIMGAGMVHPNVLRAVGYDPDVYTGFAFGMGPERVAILKYGIPDIRLFYGNDLRFLRQFP